MTKDAFRITVLAISAFAASLCCLLVLLWRYDIEARANWLERVRAEVPPGSDQQKIEAFLNRSLPGFSFDEDARRYIAVAPKGRWDDLLASRKVLVDLYVDQESRLKAADVEIWYQGL